MKKHPLEQAYETALKEIGAVTPWWSEADKLYVFSHPAYALVDYLADTPEETVVGYHRVLRAFLRHRLAGTLSPIAERMTSGRGGRRPGAGRPKGSSKPATQRVSVPIDIAQWLKNPENLEKLRAMM